MPFLLNYTITGQGFPFIFQHGLGANLQQPQGLLEGQAKVQLISMDCPGHGHSPLAENTSPSFDFYTNEVVRLMKHLRIEKAILGGISMGAGIAINMALRYPENVAALVLIRPAWLDKETPANLAILLEAAKFMGQKDGQAIFEKDEYFQQVKATLPNAAKSILGVFAATQRKEIPLVLEGMVNDRPFTELKDLAKITSPCLIIGNENDPLHPFEMTEVLQERIVGSQSSKVVSRYIDNEQHKEDVNQIIGTYIQSAVIT